MYISEKEKNVKSIYTISLQQKEEIQVTKPVACIHKPVLLRANLTQRCALYIGQSVR